MADMQNFRSALGGFNREDVVHYIEYLNRKNTNLVNQLRSENQEIMTQLEALRSAEHGGSRNEAPVDAPSTDAAAQIAALEAEISGLNTALAEKDHTISELNARISALEQQLQSAAPSMAQQELEAYRRAERMERAAKERSQQIYRQTAAALAEATTLVDGNAQQFAQIAEQINVQLQQLQASVSGSKQVFQDAAAAMYAIRGENEEGS